MEIDFDELMMNNEGGRVGRKRKTPAELAAEADRAAADEDSLIGRCSVLYVLVKIRDILLGHRVTDSRSWVVKINLNAN